MGGAGPRKEAGVLARPPPQAQALAVALRFAVAAKKAHPLAKGALSFELGLKETTGPTGGTQKGEC